MIFNSFAVRGKNLVGFGKGITGRGYAMHFDIKAWHEKWGKEGITLMDFLCGNAYCITGVKNTINSRPTRFIKRRVK